VLTIANPGSGARTALRGPGRPLAANSASSLAPRAFSCGRAPEIGRLRTGFAIVNTTGFRE